MNLYLICQEVNDGYGIYRSAVVAATSEEEARNMWPGDGAPVEWSTASRWQLDQWVSRPEDVIVEHVGIAIPALPRGVVCANYVDS